jgi:hypothetical protein
LDIDSTLELSAVLQPARADDDHGMKLARLWNAALTTGDLDDSNGASSMSACVREEWH